MIAAAAHQKLVAHEFINEIALVGGSGGYEQERALPAFYIHHVLVRISRLEAQAARPGGALMAGAGSQENGLDIAGITHGTAGNR